jgi:hypothetical protein
MSDGIGEVALVKRLMAENSTEAVLREVLTWADQRCPCANERPNPCPLCGASVENLEPCKSAENTLPRSLLDRIRAALGPVSDPSPAICPECRGERRVKGHLCPRCGGCAQIPRSALRSGEVGAFEEEPAR